MAVDSIAAAPMQARMPMSIGQVLDGGLKLYRQAFWKLVALSLSSAVLGVVPTALQMADPTNVQLVLLGGLSALPLGLLRLAFTAGLVLKLDDVYSGPGTLSYGNALLGGLRRALPLLGAYILVGGACAIGFILLIIPGIWVSVSFSLFIIALIADRTGITDSLGTSARLVQGNWWRVFAIFSVAFLVILALFLALFALGSVLTPLGGIFSVATGQAKGVAVVALLVFLGASFLVGTVLTPLFYAISLVTYRDLQVRKGGTDLAARIAAAA